MLIGCTNVDMLIGDSNRGLYSDLLDTSALKTT